MDGLEFKGLANFAGEGIYSLALALRAAVPRRCLRSRFGRTLFSGSSPLPTSNKKTVLMDGFFIGAGEGI